jgi:hypothetical protein
VIRNSEEGKLRAEAALVGDVSSRQWQLRHHRWAAGFLLPVMVGSLIVRAEVK